MVHKPYTCELCDKQDNDVDLYVGGLFMFLHPTCGDIANKAIDRYIQSLITREWSLIAFAEEILEAKKVIHSLGEKTNE